MARQTLGVSQDDNHIPVDDADFTKSGEVAPPREPEPLDTRTDQERFVTLFAEISVPAVTRRITYRPEHKNQDYDVLQVSDVEITFDYTGRFVSAQGVRRG